MDVSVSTEPIQTIRADALVVNLFENEKPSDSHLAPLDQQLQGALTRLYDLGELSGKLYRTTMIPTNGHAVAPRLLVVGSGPRADFGPDRVRNVAGTAVRSLLKRPVTSVAMGLAGAPSGSRPAEAAAIGALLATFDPGEYKTTHDDTGTGVTSLTLVEPSSASAGATSEQAERGRIIGEAANLARHLANAPGNILTPAKLADAATRAGHEAGFNVDVLDRQRMAALRMGAILAVAEGSDQPPALIVMTYHGREGEGYDVALIGKGVTFDTGGISIKPAAEMHLMKEDMAGAAATIGTFSALGRLKPRANILGIVPAVENMPSGHAMRPGDVLTAMNGKTIEVLNTDAEGRLILADAVCYAQRLGARKLIDAATLTGAVVVALGHQATGLLGTPQEWVDEIKRVSDQAGERSWQLPLFDEYAEQLRSEVADVANVGGRAAGTITGAMFIRQFVDAGVAWAHLDIAGTAWTEKELPYLAKGPTGIPVRTFIRLAEASLSSGSAPSSATAGNSG